MKTLLLGDVCPHTSSYDKFKNKGIDRIFGDVLPIFEGRDFIAVNLECALTETDGKIKKFGPALAAPIETAEVLKSVGVNLCGLSNNHIFDLGTDGIRDTLAALSAAGLDFTGFGKDETDARKNYFFEHDGERIAVVAVCEHEFSYALPDRMGARGYDPYETMEDIRAAKAEADRVIVMYHGGKEFSEYPSPRLYKLCRAMVKNGADVVLCQHSHCIGCYEKYEGGHILYGQGNFHFMDPDPRASWYTELAVEYDTKTNEISFIPIRSTDDDIMLAKGADKDEIMAGFEKRSAELKSGAWREGWHAFCESVRDRYTEAVRNAYADGADETQNQYFAHLLDCEAHTDVWREIFPTWNMTNCK